MPKYKSDDIELLAPSFRQRAKVLVERMLLRGYHPVVFDTLRTAKESAANAAKGTGIRDSMHEYNIACDVICGDHGWSCQDRDPKTKKKLFDCRFYFDLRDVIDEVGCFIGPVADLPHFQGVPVARQSLVRACGKEQTLQAIARRSAVCVRFMLPVKPPKSVLSSR